MSLKKALALVWFLLFAQAVSTAFAQNWGYEQLLLGHPGIEYRLRCENCSNPQGPYQWWVEFHNTGASRMAFSFRIAQPGLSNVVTTDRIIVDSNRSAQGWDSSNFNNAAALTVYTDKWQQGPNAQ
jgi:hypothetical protein